ncbi:hypothetical protein J3366_03370 [Tritonibacter mobilis]|uniref:hypothetical protein n=1 Tax=Tritonibacter mobilis TaxID=379347 RepID=UPI003BAC7905
MLTESLNTATCVNGLYVLARSVQETLGRYSFNLFVWTHDEIYKVSLLGSATPIFYRGHYLVLSTRHQIKNIDPQDISMLTEDGEFAVTSSGYSVPRLSPEGMQHDLQDIVVFNFNGACEEHPALRLRFFRIGEFPPDCMNDSVVAVLNYGYPSDDQLYELHDKNHIGSRRRSTPLKIHSQPQDDTLLHLKPLQPLTFDPDGLSGGPNFVIQRSDGNFMVHFAGVTVRAGRKDVYIVKSGYIKGLLDAAISLRS